LRRRRRVAIRYDVGMKLVSRFALALVVLGWASASRAQMASQWCDVDRWGSGSQMAVWNRSFTATYEALRKNDPAAAKKSAKRARKLLDDLLDAFVSGPDGSRLLGVTTYLLAVAEQRLGKSDDAAWHWQMAQDLAPGLRDAYGDFDDVIPFLRAHLIPAERWNAAANPPPGNTGHPAPPSGGSATRPVTDVGPTTPPMLKHKVNPSYPRGAREFGLDGPTVVDTYLDTQGISREPTVRHGCGVTVLDVAAMDAIRQWRYEPAVRAGKPVQVFLSVTVMFSINR